MRSEYKEVQSGHHGTACLQEEMSELLPSCYCACVHVWWGREGEGCGLLTRHTV